MRTHTHIPKSLLFYYQLIIITYKLLKILKSLYVKFTLILDMSV